MDYNCILHNIVLTTNFHCCQNFRVRGVGQGMEIELTGCFSDICKTFFANSPGLSKGILFNLR